jgi:hypothetical protein
MGSPFDFLIEDDADHLTVSAGLTLLIVHSRHSLVFMPIWKGHGYAAVGVRLAIFHTP